MSNSAIRALRVLKALRGHSLNGLSNTQLANHLNETPTNITRALQDLIAENLVLRLDNGLFVLSIACLQIAVAHAEEVNRATNRIDEFKQRIAVASHQ